MINDNNLDYQIYEWVKDWYINHEMPKVIDHYLDGKIIGTDGAPIKIGKENPYIDGLIIMFNGIYILNEIKNMITRSSEPLYNSETVKNRDDCSRYINDMKKKGDDITSFFSKETSQMFSSDSPLINNYQDVNELDLIRRGLPDNFVDYNCQIPKKRIGKKTSAGLVTTKKHPVGAVIVRESEYYLGGKVILSFDGRLVQECYAKSYDPQNNFLTLEHCKYDQGGDGYLTKPEVTQEIIQLKSKSKDNKRYQVGFNNSFEKNMPGTQQKNKLDKKFEIIPPYAEANRYTPHFMETANI